MVQLNLNSDTVLDTSVKNLYMSDVSKLDHKFLFTCKFKNCTYVVVLDVSGVDFRPVGFSVFY
jgi:hypothetical protein